MLEKLKKLMSRKSYCTIATVSDRGRPHVTGVLYEFADDRVYVIAKADTLKVRNMRANPRVAVCIPVSWLPFAPPKSIQFQAKAELLERDDREIEALLQRGKLRKITAHGIIDVPGMLFAKLTPTGNIASWGIGVSAWSILRDPVGADRVTRWGDA